MQCMIQKQGPGIYGVDIFSRVLRASISQISVGRSLRPSVRHKVFLKAFYCIFDEEKKLGREYSHFKCLFKETVGPSVCLTSFERADAGDFGLMTLFICYVICR